MSNFQAFIGICGVYSAYEQARLLNYANVLCVPKRRFIMVGVKKPLLAYNLSASPDLVRPFVHCDFAPEESFAQTIGRIVRRCPYARGWQINLLPWMEHDYAPLLRQVKTMAPDIPIILQAHKRITEEYTPMQIARRLKGQPVDYILFDASGSKGIAYNLTDMERFVGAVYRHCPHHKVVVAGGLGGHTMADLFEPLVARFPDLSCDAAYHLQGSNGHLSWASVESYLTAWLTAMKQGMPSERVTIGRR